MKYLSLSITLGLTIAVATPASAQTEADEPRSWLEVGTELAARLQSRLGEFVVTDETDPRDEILGDAGGRELVTQELRTKADAAKPDDLFEIDVWLKRQPIRSGINQFVHYRVSEFEDGRLARNSIDSTPATVRDYERRGLPRNS